MTNINEQLISKLNELTEENKQLTNKYSRLVNPQIDTNGNICAKFGNIDVTMRNDGYINATQMC